MTIASELTALQQDITNARTVIQTKGGQTTTGGGSSQLATDIATIPTGITPSGNIALTATTSTQTGINVTNYATASVAPTPSETKSVTVNGTVTPSSGKLLSSVSVNVPNGTETKSITANGTYTPTSPNIGFSSVTVNVAGSSLGIPRVNSGGIFSVLSTNWTFPSEITGIGDYACYYAQYDNDSFRTVDFNNVRTIGAYGLYYAFRNCYYLTSATGTFTSIGTYGLSYAFYGCANAETLPNLDGLTSIPVRGMDNYSYDCLKVSVLPTFNNLTSIGNYGLQNAFAGTTGTLKHVRHLTNSPNFENVTSWGNYAMDSCFGYTTIDFPTLKIKNLNTSGQYVLRYGFRECAGIDFATLFADLESVEGNYAMQYIFYDGSYETANNAQIQFPKMTTACLTNSTGTFQYLSQTINNVWFTALQRVGKTATNTSTFANMITKATTVLGTSGDLCFPELYWIGGGATSSSAQVMFANNSQARRAFFPKLNSKSSTGAYYFYGCNNLVELHFGKENQSAVEAMSGYTAKFGASNATIYFDLINHITVNGTVYDRYGQGYIINPDLTNTANNLFSWKNGNDIVYTKNAWTPAVGDTTYDSDGVSTGYTITAIS